MSWQDVKWPVTNEFIGGTDGIFDDKYYFDDEYCLDSDGNRIETHELSDIANALHTEVERLKETVAMMPKTCDGQPYLPFVDTRTFYCIYRASDETSWRKTTCKVVVPDEQMDSDQIWQVDTSGDDDCDGELFECLVYLSEEARDRRFNELAAAT